MTGRERLIDLIVKAKREAPETGSFTEFLADFLLANGVATDANLRDLLQAEKDGRLVVLPCKVGDTVFTIEEDYFNCEQCEHGAKAKYDNKIHRVCCGMDDGYHCPHYIKEHTAEGFTVGTDDAGNPSASAPGEWGYEGLETFSGIDGKWYPTREEAEAALANKGEIQK